MTDKPRPLLGLHERVDHFAFKLEQVPGLGNCPACGKLLELFLAQGGSFDPSSCPHCHAALRLIVPRTSA